MRSKLLLVILFSLLMITSANASKTVSSLHDNQVSLLNANNVLNSGVYADIGRAQYYNDLNRYLIRFDLQGISVKENITKVILRIQRVSNTWDNNEPYVLNAVAQDWSTDSVTWNNQPLYDPVSIVGASKAYGFYEFDVTDMVLPRLNGNVADYGFLIKKQNEGSEGSGLFATADYPIAGVQKRPELIIEYVADSIPSTPVSPTPTPVPPPANAAPPPESSGGIVLVSSGGWSKEVVKDLKVKMYRAMDGQLLKSLYVDENGFASFKQEDIPVQEPVYFIGEKGNFIYERSWVRMHHTVLNPGRGKEMCINPVRPYPSYVVMNCGFSLNYYLSRVYDNSDPASQIFYNEYPDYQEDYPLILSFYPAYTDPGKENFLLEMYRARDNTLLYSAKDYADYAIIHSAYIPNNEHVYFVLYKEDRRYEDTVQGKHITYIDTGSDEGICRYRDRTLKLECGGGGISFQKVNTPSQNPFDTPASEEGEEEEPIPPVQSGTPEDGSSSQPAEEDISDDDDTQLVVLEVALESLSITFKSLSEKSEAIATYYSSHDESKKEQLWREIGADFSGLHITVKKMKERIAAVSNLNPETRSYLNDKIKEIKDTLREIRTKISHSR